MRSHARVLLAVAALFVFSCLGAGSASAVFVNSGSFAGPGSGDGELDVPERVAVEQSTGNVFVVDSGNDRVQVFSQDGFSGAYLTQFGAGVLDEPVGIAIDESGGETVVYVTSQTNGGEIVRFESDEAATPAFTVDAGYSSPAQGTNADEVQSFRSAIALAPNGDLWVADSGADVVKRFDAAGAHVAGSNFDGSNGGTAFTGLLDVAVNSTGDLYVVDATGPIKSAPDGNPDMSASTDTSQAHRYGADGAYQATLLPVGPTQRPARVAVQPGTDAVAVSGEQDAIWRDQNPTVHLFDSANNFLQEFTVGGPTPYESVAGLAFTTDPVRIVVVTDFGYYAGGGTFGSQPGVQLYVDASTPEVEVTTATDITANSAQLNATIDPGGAETQWRFEYTIDGGITWENVNSLQTLPGSTGVSQAVSATLSDLQPSRTYGVRVSASNAVGSVVENGPDFVTQSSPPTVTPRPASGITLTTAKLRVSINANSEPTTYYFEYGPDTSYGSATPAKSAGEGDESRAFETGISGLAVGTTYHFRVVATNGTGTFTGPDQTFTTAAKACENASIRAAQGAGHLPQCRAWELVSPANDTSSMNVQWQDSIVSLDGGRIHYTSKMPLSQPPVGAAPPFAGYLAERDEEDGWISKGVTPAGQPGNFVSFLNGSRAYRNFSEDLRYGTIAYDGAPQLAPGGPEGLALYRSDLEAGSYETVTPNASPLSDFGELPFFVDASSDYSHIVFQTKISNDPDAPGGESNVYEWHDGDVSLVGRLPSAEGGGPVPSGTVAPNPFFSGPDNETEYLRNVVSDDGSKIFFTSDIGRQLYLRVDGQESYLLNEDENSLEDPPVMPAFFRGASRDGSRAIFLTEARLVDGDTNDAQDLYMYDTTKPASAPDNLTLISGGAVGDRTMNASGVTSTSSGGTTIYFLHKGALLPGLPTPPSIDSFYMYVWHDGDLSFVGLAPDDFSPEFISDDGTKLAFPSNREPGVPRSDWSFSNSGGGYHYHLFDLDSATTECMTCDGQIAGARAAFGYPITTNVSTPGVSPRLRTPPRNLSNDGEFIFTTTLRLSPDDRNGNLSDVYAWKGGEARLISSGRGFDDHVFATATPDHSDIVIGTRDSLVGSDRDRAYDLYDARVDGGFAEAAPAAICEGDGCQGPSAGPPTSDQAGSGSLVGPGNVRPAVKCGRRLAAVKKAKRLLSRADGADRAAAKKQLARAKRALADCRGGGR